MRNCCADKAARTVSVWQQREWRWTSAGVVDVEGRLEVAGNVEGWHAREKALDWVCRRAAGRSTQVADDDGVGQEATQGDAAGSGATAASPALEARRSDGGGAAERDRRRAGRAARPRPSRSRTNRVDAAARRHDHDGTAENTDEAGGGYVHGADAGASVDESAGATAQNAIVLRRHPQDVYFDRRTFAVDRRLTEWPVGRRCPGGVERRPAKADAHLATQHAVVRGPHGQR